MSLSKQSVENSTNDIKSKNFGIDDMILFARLKSWDNLTIFPIICILETDVSVTHKAVLTSHTFLICFLS